MTTVKIEPHVARRVRRTACKDTERKSITATSAVSDICASHSAGHASYVSKLRPKLWSALRKAGVAGFDFYDQPSLKPSKRDHYITGEWGVESGRIIFLCWHFDLFTNHAMMGFTLTVHATERISERLGTIDPERIRDEMTAVPASLLMATAADLQGDWDPYQQCWMIKTPHGVAAVVSNGLSEYFIKTWIADDDIKDPRWRRDWAPLKPIIESRAMRRYRLRVVGCSIDDLYLPRVDTAPRRQH